MWPHQSAPTALLNHQDVVVVDNGKFCRVHASKPCLCCRPVQHLEAAHVRGKLQGSAAAPTLRRAAACGMRSSHALMSNAPSSRPVSELSTARLEHCNSTRAALTGSVSLQHRGCVVYVQQGT
jgi:hypothetical protein